MIYEHFKISDTDDSVLDTSDLPNIELRCDSVQTLDTKWDETASAMQKKSDEQLLENLYFRLEKSEQPKPAGRLAPTEVQTSEPMSYTKLNRMVVRCLEQKIREGVKNLTLWKGKREETAKGDCNQWVSICHCSRAQACSVKHDRTKKGTEREARGEASRDREVHYL